MDLKKAAATAAITFIEDKMNVGLGAGSTISHIADLLTLRSQEGLRVQLFTSSFSTRLLLQQKGFLVHQVSQVAELDIYLDGCDQVDKDLHALKSGGGIHTLEKLLASMAKQFILVGDEAKYTLRFDNRFPLVTELLPEALGFVPAALQKLFPGVRSELRRSDKKDGAVITESGNYLLDSWFTNWPPPEKINLLVKPISGVVETSLFYNLAHKAILAGRDGIKVLEKVH